MNAALPTLAAAAGDSPTKNSRHKTAVFSCPVAIKRAQHTGIVHNSAADQLGQLQCLSCPVLLSVRWSQHPSVWKQENGLLLASLKTAFDEL